MKPYTHFSPTIFFFGKNCLQEKADIFSRYGKKAYIVTSKFAEGCENLALKELTALFDSLGIAYGVTDAVEENPPIRNIVEMTKPVRAFQPDFLIGVGGGSSIDSAKAISVMLEYPAEYDNIPDATKALYDGDLPHEALYSDGKLPVLAIPTTAGTGAEVTAFSVITNEETHAKKAISHPVFCKVAFLDSRYMKDAPSFIIHTGAMDALAHGVESYVNKKGTDMNRAFAEIGFRLFAQFKDNMLNNCMTDEDYEKQTMFSNIMGFAFMRAGTTIPHGMGYALSTFKGVNHGLSCSVCLGEYLKCFKEQENIDRVNKAVTLCGFDTVDEFADYMAEIISRDLHITVTEEELEQWSHDFFNQTWRLTKHPEPITFEDVNRIYHASLKHYIEK